MAILQVNYVSDALFRLIMNCSDTIGFVSAAGFTSVTVPSSRANMCSARSLVLEFSLTQALTNRMFIFSLLLFRF